MFKDPGLEAPLLEPPWAEDLVRDLGLSVLVQAMAGEDEALATAARSALLRPLESVEEIKYRQEILDDVLAHPGLARDLYAKSGDAVEAARRIAGGVGVGSDSVLRRSLETVKVLLPVLRWLRDTATRGRTACQSEGLTSLFSALVQSLDDAFFSDVEEYLSVLRFRDGVSLRGRLGQRGEPAQYETRSVLSDSSSLAHWFRRGDAMTYVVPERDEGGRRSLSEFRARGIAPLAEAMAQGAKRLVDFLGTLREETAFYVGCLNLAEASDREGLPRVRPTPWPTPTKRSSRTRRGFVCRDLRDVGLALTLGAEVVGNDVKAGPASLVVVTGANRGGKSTFLRSLGQAQAMMQAGMFVAAEAFSSAVAPGIVTHFTRGEDVTLRRGKLDDELTRMSARVDHLAPGSLVLCNESFASTNEREGSEIGRQVVGALVESGIRVVYVTHLYDLAHGWVQDPPGEAVFLRAERRKDGSRPFRLVQAEPLGTSFGQDIYHQVFGGRDR